jgi:hypothetical protein
MRQHVDPTTLSRVQRAMSGACYDCMGSGNRESITRQRVPCATCDGTGRLEWYTVAGIAAGTIQVRGGPGLSLSKVQDALQDMLESGRATRRFEPGKPDLWQLVK